MDFSQCDYGGMAPDEITTDQMTSLQRWVLTHSYLYYNLDQSVKSDHEFDANANWLYALRMRRADLWENTKFAYAMEEFTGDTGMGLFESLNEKDKKGILMGVGYIAEHYKLAI